MHFKSYASRFYFTSFCPVGTSGKSNGEISGHDKHSIFASFVTHPCTSDPYNPSQLPCPCLLACMCVCSSPSLPYCFDTCMTFFSLSISLFLFLFVCIFLCTHVFNLFPLFLLICTCNKFIKFLFISLSTISLFHSLYISLNIFLHFNEYVLLVHFTNIN